MATILNRIAPVLLTATFAALAAAPAVATEFQVDPAHSQVGFSVKHMMISTVNGHFNDYTGSFDFDPTTGKLSSSKFEVKVASIDTGNAKRDDHLKSPDFFDAGKFPTITVTNSKIKKVSDGKFDWDADMTMHGVTKPVHFAMEFAGQNKGMDGAMHAGFSATAKIKRSDWGLKWNKALESGGVMVSEEVMLTVEVEAVAKK